MNRKVRLIIQFAAGIGIFIALFKFIPYQDVISAFSRSQKRLVVLAFCISLIPYVLGVYRWQVLLASQGFLYSFKELLPVYLSSLFFNLFFPSFVASDVFRSIALTKSGERKKILSTVIMDRFSGMMGMGIMVMLAYPFGRRMVASTHIFVPVALFIGLILISSLIIFSRRFFAFITGGSRFKGAIIQKVKEVHAHLYFFKQAPRVFGKSLIYSMVLQSFPPLYIFILFIALGIHLSFLTVFIIVPIVLALASLPLTISGIGTREAAFVCFFLGVGVPRDVSLAVSLFTLFFGIVVALIGGVVYVTFYHRRVQLYQSAP